MVRLGSCRGHEFAPVFGLHESDHESGSSSEDDGRGDADPCFNPETIACGNPDDLAGADADSAASPESESAESFEDVAGAFADARDRWKIDSETLKGFYLHSATGQLYSWDQARGILYEYCRESGHCNAVWGAGTPQVNAQIWSVLPLPPTDPASLQGPTETVQSSRVLCIIHLSRSRVRERARTASSVFCSMLGLDAKALLALESLPPEAQAYVARTFCAPTRDPSGALRRQVKSLAALPPNDIPWKDTVETATLRVPASGAIIGRCVPEVAALMWYDDESDLVAAAHCRISFVSGRFSVCDLKDDDDGTLFDGRRLGSEWAPLNDGTCLQLGPVAIRVELSPVKSAFTSGLALPPLISNSTVAEGKTRPPPKSGTWRSAKRTSAKAGHEDRVEKSTSSPSQTVSSRMSAIRRPALAVNAMTKGKHMHGVEETRRPQALGCEDVKRPQGKGEKERKDRCGTDRRAKKQQRCEEGDVGKPRRGRAFWAVPCEPSDSSDSSSSERREAPSWIPRTP